MLKRKADSDSGEESLGSLEDESEIDLDDDDVEFDDEEFSKEFGDIDVDEDLCEEDFVDLGN